MLSLKKEDISLRRGANRNRTIIIISMYLEAPINNQTRRLTYKSRARY